MNYTLNKGDRLIVLRIVLIYALFGMLWVYLSDSVAALLIRDPAILIEVSVFKGILFILLTSLLLYQLIGSYVRRLGELNQSLEERVAKDVAELRQKDRLLIQQSRMAAMGEMLGNIAHQWRQPLNVLGLMVQQLQLFYEEGELTRENLDENTGKAMEIILHLSQTIDDFRDFYRPDKEKRLFSVNQVVAKTVSLVLESFREQGIIIDVTTIGDPQISGYPNEYAQVLLNILMNARDALVEHKVDDALISIHAFAEGGGTTVVTISDNAGGIDEEIIGRLFDSYFTTKGPDKGTGIGLFMSKTIIEKNMGGSLTVRNIGTGAEFRIEV